MTQHQPPHRAPAVLWQPEAIGAETPSLEKWFFSRQQGLSENFSPLSLRPVSSQPSRPVRMSGPPYPNKSPGWEQSLPPISLIYIYDIYIYIYIFISYDVCEIQLFMAAGRLWRAGQGPWVAPPLLREGGPATVVRAPLSPRGNKAELKWYQNGVTQPKVSGVVALPLGLSSGHDFSWRAAQAA